MDNYEYEFSTFQAAKDVVVAQSKSRNYAKIVRRNGFFIVHSKLPIATALAEDEVAFLEKRGIPVIKPAQRSNDKATAAEFATNASRSKTHSRIEADADQLDYVSKDGEAGITAMIENALAVLRDNILDIESRDDLSRSEKVDRIRTACCTVCAAVAVQPIPFADALILTPIQAYAGTRIGAIYGLSVTEASVTRLVKELFGVVGLGFISQQLAIGAYKTVLPFMGAITTVPLVYGLSFAVCSVIEYYFEQKCKGLTVDPDHLRDIWKASKREGQKQAPKDNPPNSIKRSAVV